MLDDYSKKLEDFRAELVAQGKRETTVNDYVNEVQRYLRNQRATPEDFVQWKQGRKTYSTTPVLSFFKFLGYTNEELGMRRYRKRDARVDDRKALRARLRKLGTRFTFREALEVAEVCESNLQAFLNRWAYRRPGCYYQGEKTRFLWVYSLEPFGEDVSCVDLGDPYKPDEITLELQLLGDELERYEELLAYRRAGYLLSNGRWQKKKKARRTGDNRMNENERIEILETLVKTEEEE